MTLTLVGIAGGDDGDAAPVTASESASRSTTTTAAPSTTTTPASPTVTVATAVADGEDHVVARIVDGDTLELAGGTTVRIIGIDTPETKHPSRPVECFGREATAYTEERFPPGTPVRVVYDVERQDRYGRDLVYLYRAADGLFLNLRLVLDGFAQVSTLPPNVAHVEDFVAAE